MVVRAGFLAGAVALGAGASQLPACTIDTHTHFVDSKKIEYLGDPEQSHYPSEYANDSAAVGTPSRVVFVEVAAKPTFNVQEVAFAQSIAEIQAASGWTPGIKAIVGWAPLEIGLDVVPVLKEMKATSPLFVGVRRRLFDDYEDDAGCGILRSGLVDGLRALAEHDLHWELLVRTRAQYACALQVLERAPEALRVVVEHTGSLNATDPASFDDWKAFVATLAKRRNTIIKIGGVPERAAQGFDNWSEEQVAPYINHALGAFGYDRAVFDGNWFVIKSFTSYTRWVTVLMNILKHRGAETGDIENLFCHTADRFYAPSHRVAV